MRRSERILARGSPIMNEKHLEHEVWGPPATYPSVKDIEVKLSYRCPNTHPGEAWRTGFHQGLREILERALQLPRDCDYARYFELPKWDDLFWFLRADRGLGGERISLKYPDEIAEWYRKAEGTDSMILWGDLSGRIAAMRWLSDPSRQLAEQVFPDLDS